MTGSEAPTRLAPFATDAEALELVAAFRREALDRASFNHRAHLVVSLWYLDHHSIEEARALVPEAIRRFNARVGAVPKPRGGYHETITQFYLSMIDTFRREWRGSTSIAARANALYHQLADRSVVARYYSEELLWSPEARLRWVEPDLHPID